MHPGIVTKEEFLQAQEIFKKYGPVKRVTDKTYPLWKKVVNDGDRKNADMAKKLTDLQRDREKCDADWFSNVDLFMSGKLGKDIY